MWSWTAQWPYWQSEHDRCDMQVIHHPSSRLPAVPNAAPWAWGCTVPDAWGSVDQRPHLHHHHAPGNGFRKAVPRPLSYVHTPIPQSPPYWSNEWSPQQHASLQIYHNPNISYATPSAPKGLPSSMESRGPPMKPKRSGHALWVGNLHPATSITELKDHFSQAATEDIESVFLIARSTCAFVNYRSEQACRSAQYRFHTSKLRGNALVCRLRRDVGPANGTTLPTSPTVNLKEQFGNVEGADEPTTPVIVETPSNTHRIPTPAPEPVPAKTVEKFFVLKSLTVQDLQDSVRTGIWVTQPHNEAHLNKAYQDSAHVYLIFSVNKSREYFGFARMASAISFTQEEASGTTTVASVECTRHPSRAPLCIETCATLWAPKGRIVDDTARGTVFWEASVTDDAQSPPDTTSDTENIGDAEGAGRKFQVEWLNIERVPFFRTRGLRNLWNANREVKIARDGTEIEPTTGRRLLALFQRPLDHPDSFRGYG